MRRWVAAGDESLARLPTPGDYPQAHADGADADRVLLFGTGVVSGWGAATHADSLAGNLAVALSDLTSRGTVVDVLAVPQLRAADAISHLALAKLWRFDLIVISVGLHDALHLTAVETWRSGLEAMLSEVASLVTPHARVVLLDSPPVESLASFTGGHVATVDAHAMKLAAVATEVVAALPRVSQLHLTSDPNDFSAVGIEIADSVLDELNISRAESAGDVRGPAGQDAADRERERSESVAETGLLDSAPEDRYDRIVTMARQLYGTSGAAFAVVDSDRVWHKSRTDGVPLEVAANASMCSTTILGRGTHVEHDLSVSGAPVDPTATNDYGVSFYAGYPVESPSGEQIGALCIFDPKPRSEADFDETLLRQLALLIQAELQVDASGAR